MPFGDLFNHSNYSCTHYVVNYKFEKEGICENCSYKVKKNKLNMEIFNDESLLEEKNAYFYKSGKLKFVK